MNDLFRELKTSSLFQIPFFACLGSLMFALAAWLLRHLCLSPWFYGSLCLALALASWAAIHPLDYFFRTIRKLDLAVSAKISFATAISVTFLSAALFLRLFNSSSSACFNKIPRPPAPPTPTKHNQSLSMPQPALELTKTQTLQWRKWHAMLWNTMFLNQSFPSDIPVGTKAEYSFKVNRRRQILDVDVRSDNEMMREFVLARINELNGTDVLQMPLGSSREVVIHNSNVAMCVSGEEGCNVPSEGYNDDEKITVFK